jgi:hypothetical protein
MGTVAVPLTSFNDPIPTNTAANEAARAVSVAAQAKAATDPARALQLTREANAILANSKALAAKEAKKDEKVTLVETGKGTGEILGMEPKTFMIMAAVAAVLVVMEKK